MANYTSGQFIQARELRSSIDWTLILCYLALVVIGWINIYASIHSSDPVSIFDWNCRSGKQAVWIAGAFLMNVLIIFVINPRLWEVICSPAYFFVLILLVAVIFLGVEIKGSRSWFALGPVRFQPAEISKITTSMMLAMIMSKAGFRLTNGRNFLSICLIVALPMLIILAEKETGSALVYVGFIFVLYREGLSGWFLFLFGMFILLFSLTLVTSWWISLSFIFILTALYIWRYWKSSKRERISVRIMVVRNAIFAFIIGGSLIFATNFIFENVLQDHQRKRIEVLLGLKEDPSGVGYNVRQSMIAIGSGGLLGKGYLHGTQTTYGFVPEQSTDFIFCTIGEEWGFVGCLVVILLYGLMIMRIIQDADDCRESFNRIYGYCLAACLFMHLFINIGMTIGLMPVIGIPLPLLSYGGSSLWAFSIMIFIFISLYRQEKKYF